MERVSLKLEAWKLTTDELLKRMSKEQAIIFIQGILRRMEESLDEPEIPASLSRAFYLFHKFFSVRHIFRPAKPPLSPPFHPHSLVSDCRSVQGGCT